MSEKNMDAEQEKQQQKAARIQQLEDELAVLKGSIPLYELLERVKRIESHVNEHFRRELADNNLFLGELANAFGMREWSLDKLLTAAEKKHRRSKKVK